MKYTQRTVMKKFAYTAPAIAPAFASRGSNPGQTHGKKKGPSGPLPPVEHLQ
jgi:hypothetical protein